MSSIYSQMIHDAWYGAPISGGLEEQCRTSPNGCDDSDVARAKLLDGINFSKLYKNGKKAQQDYNDDIYSAFSKSESYPKLNTDRPWSKKAMEDAVKNFDAVRAYQNAPVIETDRGNSVPVHKHLEALDEVLKNAVLGYESPEYEKWYEEEHPDGVSVKDIAKDMVQYLWTPTSLRLDARDISHGRVPGLLDAIGYVPGIGTAAGAVKGIRNLNKAKKAGKTIGEYRKAGKKAKAWIRGDEADNYAKRPVQSLLPGGIDPNALYDIKF